MLGAGQIAPQFQLKDLNGNGWSLNRNLENGPVLVAFFKISCPTCQLTLPFLERLSSAVTVAGISQDEAGSTKEFCDYFGIRYPVAIDPANSGYAVSMLYRLTNVPSLFLVEPDGIISWALNGFHQAELQKLAGRFGVELFRAEDKVPAMKPG